jgi:hypothetical protein
MFSALPIVLGSFCATVLRKHRLLFQAEKKGGKEKLNLVGPFGTVSTLTLDIMWQKKGSFSGGHSVLCLATGVQGKQ